MDECSGWPAQGGHEPQAAYEVLERLITKEWRTPAFEAETDAKGVAQARVFHGEYEITVRDGGQVRRRTVSVGKDAPEEGVLFQMSATDGEPDAGDE